MRTTKWLLVLTVLALAAACRSESLSGLRSPYGGGSGPSTPIDTTNTPTL